MPRWTPFLKDMEEFVMLVNKASLMWSALTVKSIGSSNKWCMRIDIGLEITRLPTGVFVRRTEILASQEGPI